MTHCSDSGEAKGGGSLEEEDAEIEVVTDEKKAEECVPQPIPEEAKDEGVGRMVRRRWQREYHGVEMNAVRMGEATVDKTKLGMKEAAVGKAKAKG